MAGDHRGFPVLCLFFSWILTLRSISLAYTPADILPMSKAGQYHGSRSVWHDVIGRHCPIFAVDREVLLIPMPKPADFSGADPYKMEEHSEIDVSGGLYVMFGSGLLLSFILAIYALQSSQDKLARFVRETDAESSLPGGVGKVE